MLSPTGFPITPACMMTPMSTHYAGVGVSRGAAAGPVVRVVTPAPPPREEAGQVDVEAEIERAQEALAAVATELEDLAHKVGATGAVLVAQARIARDPALLAMVSESVRSHRRAGRAIYDTLAAYRDMRAADPLRPVPPQAELDDVRDRAVAWILGEPAPGIPDPGTPFVLVARDLSPSVTATLDPQRVLALVTERGGPTSHTAVLAKTLGIPAVVACAGAAALVDGAQVVVDGSAGTVTVDPERELVTTVHERREAGARRRAQPTGGPGRTRDGRPVRMLVAVGGPGDLDKANRVGAEGVGVFRTEFLFLGRDDPPTTAEQTTAYRAVFSAFAGRQVTVRTLDVGADKPLPFVPLGDQTNPALGVRGLRVARRDPRLLTDQLRAIARAAAGSDAQVRVMAPMVATAAEGAWFAALAHAEGLTEAGVMVEVPAAALRAADLLRAVDFLSVGTNDLSQYTFAADRQVGELADLLDFWQPALLQLIAAATSAGTAVGVPVTVCGEAAADPLLAPVLVGLGAEGLSMSPRMLPEVRAAIAERTFDECRALAASALAASSPEEARALVAAAIRG